MRNLMEYPITTDEIISCLRELVDALNAKARIGDMQPILLYLAANIIEQTQKQFNEEINKWLRDYNVSGHASVQCPICWTFHWMDPAPIGNCQYCSGVKIKCIGKCYHVQ
jgi:hypothetical protein